MIEFKTWQNGSETVPAVDGRQLHKALGIGRDFSTWLNARLTYGYVENEDFTTCLVPRGTGTPAREYTLSLPMAAELCLLERSDIGQALRRFILDQQPIQNAAISYQNCVDHKPMWELSIDELQHNTLKACIRCKTPFKGDGDLCQACIHFDKVQGQKAALIRQRNGSNVTTNELVQCLIERDGDTTMKAPGSFGTIITFRRNQYGHAVARIENPVHRANILKSIFYRSYTPPKEAA